MECDAHSRAAALARASELDGHALFCAHADFRRSNSSRRSTRARLVNGRIGFGRACGSIDAGRPVWRVWFGTLGGVFVGRLRRELDFILDVGTLRVVVRVADSGRLLDDGSNGVVE